MLQNRWVNIFKDTVKLAISLESSQVESNIMSSNIKAAAVPNMPKATGVTSAKTKMKLHAQEHIYKETLVICSRDQFHKADKC